jgi:hypothetical protein
MKHLAQWPRTLLALGALHRLVIPALATSPGWTAHRKVDARLDDNSDCDSRIIGLKPFLVKRHVRYGIMASTIT